MPDYPSENASFLRKGDIVNIGIDLPDKTFAEDVATVVATESGEILLSLCGSGFPSHMPIRKGSKVLITSGDDRSIFHSTARLNSHPVDSTLSIEYPKEVKVRARREQMRSDVLIPVHYYKPTDQNLGRVISEWENLKKCAEWCCEQFQSAMVEHNSRVNLSGSGLRFKIRDCLSYGTLLHLKIELPDLAHIHGVGSIVRTKELVPELSHIEYYSTSMIFRMIDSNDRLKLIRHIIDEQHRRIDELPTRYL
ncbi:MAG: DUF5634 family protein [Geobacteraceae bacterium]|nr:DUF5634 family protein [Geobacteraceae bacterium]